MVSPRPTLIHGGEEVLPRQAPITSRTSAPVARRPEFRTPTSFLRIESRVTRAQTAQIPANPPEQSFIIVNGLRPTYGVR